MVYYMYVLCTAYTVYTERRKGNRREKKTRCRFQSITHRLSPAPHRRSRRHHILSSCGYAPEAAGGGGGGSFMSRKTTLRARPFDAPPYHDADNCIRAAAFTRCLPRSLFGPSFYVHRPEFFPTTSTNLRLLCTFDERARVPGADRQLSR